MRIFKFAIGSFVVLPGTTGRVTGRRIIGGQPSPEYQIDTIPNLWIRETELTAPKVSSKLTELAIHND